MRITIADEIGRKAHFHRRHRDARDDLINALLGMPGHCQDDLIDEVLADQPFEIVHAAEHRQAIDHPRHPGDSVIDKSDDLHGQRLALRDELGKSLPLRPRAVDDDPDIEFAARPQPLHLLKRDRATDDQRRRCRKKPTDAPQAGIFDNKDLEGEAECQ